MNNDLISREALKENEPHYDEEGYRIFYESEIDNAPTVEPRIEFGTDGQPYRLFMSGGQVVPDMLQGWRYEERPTGRWIRKVDEVGFISHICSECGAEIEVEDCSDDKFCFNCGAKMKGGKE